MFRNLLFRLGALRILVICPTIEPAASFGHHRDSAGDGSLPLGDRPRGRAAICSIGPINFELGSREELLETMPSRLRGAGDRTSVGSPRMNCVADLASTPAGRWRKPRTNNGNAVSNPRIRVCSTVVLRFCLQPHAIVFLLPCLAYPQGMMTCVRTVDNEHQNSCGTTGCRTGSLNPTTTSSTIAALPGTGLSISHGKSCPSVCEIGHTSRDQRDLVSTMMPAAISGWLLAQFADRFGWQVGGTLMMSYVFVVPILVALLIETSRMTGKVVKLPLVLAKSP